MTQLAVKHRKFTMSPESMRKYLSIQKNYASSEESIIGLNLLDPNEKTWYNVVEYQGRDVYRQNLVSGKIKSAFEIYIFISPDVQMYSR